MSQFNLIDGKFLPHHPRTAYETGTEYLYVIKMMHEGETIYATVSVPKKFGRSVWYCYHALRIDAVKLLRRLLVC